MSHSTENVFLRGYFKGLLSETKHYLLGKKHSVILYVFVYVTFIQPGKSNENQFSFTMTTWVRGSVGWNSSQNTNIAATNIVR